MALTGSAAFWECWEEGLIPGLAEWVKDSVLPQLQLRLQLRLRSDPWLCNSICRGWGGSQKKKKDSKCYSENFEVLPLT